jgi:hypothetical protein
MWEVRFSEYLNGKRHQKCLTFDPSEYPTEASVRKAIEQQVILQNSKTGRVKVGAGFGAICALYRREHLPTLRHSTQGTNEYLLRDYIEPQWSADLLPDVSPLAVSSWIANSEGEHSIHHATVFRTGSAARIHTAHRAQSHRSGSETALSIGVI